jgi:hypothetical protein
MKITSMVITMLLCAVATFATNLNGTDSDNGKGDDKAAKTANTATTAEASRTVPTWQFLYIVGQPTDEQLAQMSADSELGRRSAFLLDELQNLCVKRVPVVPGDPTTRIVIKKGELFNAARKVAKGLEADVRTNRLTADAAAATMDKVLTVAISAFYAEDSKSFEKALKDNKKDFRQLLALFTNVTLI